MRQLRREVEEYERWVHDLALQLSRAGIIPAIRPDLLNLDAED